MRPGFSILFVRSLLPADRPKRTVLAGLTSEAASGLAIAESIPTKPVSRPESAVFMTDRFPDRGFLPEPPSHLRGLLQTL